MISFYHFELKLPEKIQTYNIGSVLHGVIISALSAEMQSLLHNETRYSPLKQRVIRENERYIWEIISLNDALSKELDEQFLYKESIYIAYHQAEIPMSLITKQIINPERLIKEVHQKESAKYYNLQFLTPTSFKSAGKFEIFPDVKKIFRSVMLNYDAFFDDYQLYDSESLEFLASCSEIVHYQLRSTSFSLEGVRIPAYIGKLTIRVKAPLAMRQLAEILLVLGEYTGVGVKTSLGMGKFRLLE